MINTNEEVDEDEDKDEETKLYYEIAIDFMIRLFIVVFFSPF